MDAVIGLGQLRSDACGYLERVLTGETIGIVRRGKLVARIVSAADDRPTPTALPDLVAVNGAGGRIGLDALRRHAGRYFDRLAAGETIWIVWRDKLVARVVPAGESAEGSISRRSIDVAARDAGRRVELIEFRTRAGHYFDRVAAGEAIEVTRGGKLAARIVAAGDPKM